MKKTFAIVTVILALMGVFLFRPTQQKEKHTPVPRICQLPMYFESNDGQADPTIKYIVRKNKHLFLFTPKEILIQLPQFSLLRMEFVGGNADPILKGLNEQECK